MSREESFAKAPIAAAAVRAMALSLPCSEEQGHFGAPSFRVKGKIFAQVAANAAHVTIKLSIADQAALTATDSTTFSSVPHWGRFGWTQVALAGMDADFLLHLLANAWRQIAPKKLIAAHDSQR